jgi:hypothetical protein
MEKTKQPAPTAVALLRALVAAIDKDSHWPDELHAAYSAAEKFLGKKGKP